MSASWGMSKRELEKLLEEGKRRQPPYMLIFDSQKRPIGYVDAQRKNFSIEKSQPQKKLDKIANHSLEKYVENTHSRVQDLSASLGLKLKYGKPLKVLETCELNP